MALTPEKKMIKYVISDINSHLTGAKIERNSKNDIISRNGHRIKIIQPNLMIYVSFFPAEDALSNAMKIDITFSL